MKTFEYNPFEDAYVPYIVYPSRRPMRTLWEALAETPMPRLSRWIIYRAFINFKKNY